MKTLVFAASNSKQSINKALATHAAQVYQANFQPDAVLEILDLNDYEMPIYSIDREQADGIPDLAKQFLAKIGTADNIIISYAEHNGSYTAAWKNIFDWMSRIEMKVFQNKPMLVLATSPGQGGAASVLNAAIQSAPHFTAEVEGSLSVPDFYDNFDSDKGELTNAGLIEDLNAVLGKL